MNVVSLKYGKGLIEVELPKGSKVNILEAQFSNQDISSEDGTSLLIRAMENPIGTKLLSQIVSKGQKVVIMVSDITRPSPTKKILPHILSELYKGGIDDCDITIIFGMGIHRSHTEEEQKYLVGEEIYSKIKCIDSNKEEYINCGNTSRGTPINLCKSLVQADIRICTGNIEYHYFAGYSGGAKAIMPGAADYLSIKKNHSLQLDKNAASGILYGNPVREDIDEVGNIINIQFILNVVLNEKKQILKAFAGDYLYAHREGCKYLDSLYSVEIKELVDIVIVSSGGYPKDINLYQAQKALDNASQAVKRGGSIILIAECIEGFGEAKFEEWICSAKSPNEIVNRLKHEFVLGGHKASAIARIAQKANIYFISSMNKEDINKMFFIHKNSAAEALTSALAKKGANSKIIVIPQGSSILPKYINIGVDNDE